MPIRLPFKKVIYVFEDVDAASDVVHARTDGDGQAEGGKARLVLAAARAAIAARAAEKASGGAGGGAAEGKALARGEGKGGDARAADAATGTSGGGGGGGAGGLGGGGWDKVGTDAPTDLNAGNSASSAIDLTGDASGPLIPPDMLASWDALDLAGVCAAAAARPASCASVFRSRAARGGWRCQGRWWPCGSPQSPL